MKNKKARLRRRRRFVRSMRRMVRGVLLMPGRIPPIDLRTVEMSMRLCETFGVLFVITLIARLSTTGMSAAASMAAGNMSFIIVCNIITGVIFTALLLFIKLAGYQDRLVRMKMADYIYIR